MEQTPLILAPISTQPAWHVGADLDPGFGERWLTALRIVVVVNLLGLPSVAVPVLIGDGKPQVMQIVGPRFREDLSRGAAEAIEAQLPCITPIDPRQETGDRSEVVRSSGLREFLHPGIPRWCLR
jgi:amidase